MWRRIRPRVGALIGWVSLFTGVNLVVIGGFAAALFALGSLGETAIGIAIALAVILSIAYAVVGAWLGVKLIYVPSAITLERLGVRAAIRRSWTLIRGSYWKTLGIYLLVYVIYYAASQIISTPLGIILGVVGGLLGTNGGDETSATITIVVVYAASIILSLVVGAIGTVMLSATTALLYLDLRMRREGLDLELARFVEARAAGQEGLRDPYEPPLATAGVAPSGHGGPAAPGQYPGSGPAAPGGTVYPPSSGSPWA
nr:glycerophosphoryl diester phosphodiesterase membrane domain-containing protein [Schumannella luteola]